MTCLSRTSSAPLRLPALTDSPQFEEICAAGTQNPPYHLAIVGIAPFSVQHPALSSSGIHPRKVNTCFICSQAIPQNVYNAHKPELGAKRSTASFAPIAVRLFNTEAQNCEDASSPDGVKSEYTL